ncbi:hypothetical protein PYCCODRAFT_1393621 [Trametes coccinea BRFM310]|uniref:Uncharacterized protein n=1 Tax=Trametes coccinea (strain BRFM310) TaxID=1353009 RepID=A0A1Y2IGJ8_TRAC3|nr:hypothetical protein PYCCODRAFT_1393621 [Trametes coccinea BRFM310]
MAQFSFLKAEVLALFLETLLSGVLTILYAISVWILIYRRPRLKRSRSRFDWWMFAVVTSMYALVIAHLIVDLLHVMSAFVDHGNDPDVPPSFYEHQGTVLSYIASPAFFALLTLECDLFMTYRVYVVWRRKALSLVIPLSLITGHLIAAGVTAAGLFAGPMNVSDGLLSPVVYKPMIAYISLTLLTNFTTTLLLLGPIMWHDREMRRTLGGYNSNATSQAHWQVMKTVIQSEALYLSVVFINLVLYIVRSNGVQITFAVLPPLEGISFTMIISRIGLSDALDELNGATHLSDVSTLRVADPPPSPAAYHGGMVSIPITMHISRTVDSESRRDEGDAEVDSKASREELTKVVVIDDGSGGDVVHLCPIGI